MPPDSTLLFGRSPCPFYIVAPPLIQQSAGIRLLYQLAHMLNSMGEQAWIVPDWAPLGASNSLTYTAPTLTTEIAETHLRENMTPVVVYPETLEGNPLQAAVVARWILNSPGLLGGPSTFDVSEERYFYTQRLAQSAGSNQRLFLPTTDLREIDKVPSTPWQKRARSAPVLIYAAKYRQFVGVPRLPRWLNDGSAIHIEREGPSRQSRTELLHLMANARCLVAYENTAAITEAVLLGTPVILRRSPFFPAVLTDSELGTDGTAWSTQDDPMDAALSTLGGAREAYVSSWTESVNDVHAFRLRSRGRAHNEDYVAQLDFRSDPKPIDVTWRKRAAYAGRVIRERGPRAGLAASLDFLARRLGHDQPP